MKTKITKLAIIFLITVVCTSCVVEAFNGIKGDRNVVTENRKITADLPRLEQVLVWMLTSHKKTRML